MLLAFCIAPTSRLVGQEVVGPDSMTVSYAIADDSVAAVEKARLHLQLRQFAEAYAAAEEAASEAGINPSSTNLALPDSFDVEQVASILLYRGLSLELQRSFPEAAADYNGFLRLEPSSPRSAELGKRLPYVQAQAVRTRTRRFRDDGEIPPNEAFANGARFALGVFPLYNESSILAMSQVAFGLTGVLRNVLSLLDQFTDRPLAPVPYAHIRFVLDEILPQEVYSEAEIIPASELARVLDTDYLVFGRLNEVVGSLTANLTVGRAASDEPAYMSEVQSSYSQTGLQNLQLEMALALADSIQAMSGFEYTPSREAFADSLTQYLITDVEQFLSYGFAMEQLLIGDPAEGRILLMDTALPLAQRDLPEIRAVFAGDSPPADNLFELTATSDELATMIQEAYEDSVAAAAAAAAAATADSLRRVQLQAANTGRPVRRSMRTAREVLVVSATADRALGSAAVSIPRLDVFSMPGFPAADPRTGKSGTLDPTRQRPGIPVRIEIPIPRQAPPGNSSER